MLSKGNKIGSSNREFRETEGFEKSGFYCIEFANDAINVIHLLKPTPETVKC